jgi:hypothetical protein
MQTEPTSAISWSEVPEKIDAGKVRALIIDGENHDRKGVVAGTTSADSAPIGDSRALYRHGILSHVNGAATRLGGRVGMPLKEFVDLLIAASKR